jgi:hypothetical protein
MARRRDGSKCGPRVQVAMVTALLEQLRGKDASAAGVVSKYDPTLLDNEP